MKDRILVIDGHPDPDRARLCHALAAAYVEGARTTGKQTRVITLAEAKFPILRTAAEFLTEPDAAAIISAREDILWADHIVLIFPLWLGSAPALVRAFSSRWRALHLSLKRAGAASGQNSEDDLRA